MRIWLLGVVAAGCILASAQVASAASWSAQSTPNPSGFDLIADFTGVSCTSVSACTAVGTYNFSSPYQLLVERWDGSAWSLQSTSSVTGQLLAVSCDSATSCTAVGFVRPSGGAQTLVEHWDGSAWQAVPTPNPNDYAVLDGSGHDLFDPGERLVDPRVSPS